MNTTVQGLIVLLLAFCNVATFACDKLKPTRSYIPGPHDYTISSADTMLWREGDIGERLFLTLRVVDTCANAVRDARVRVLHADANGNHASDRWRVDAVAQDGQLRVSTIVPGYAGDIPRHIHFVINHPGYAELVTRLYFRDDAALAGEDDLALLLEEVERDGKRGWISGFQFVLKPL